MKLAMMSLTAAAAMIASAPAQADAKVARLLVIPFGFVDTSGELRDQKAEHASRLAMMSTELSSELEQKGLYKLVQRSDAGGACEAGDTACILKQAQTAGADIVLAGAIQKISTMASSIWIGAFDASDGKRVFFRQLTFRGDTDEAWHHATSFLAHQIEADPPRVQ